MGLDSFKMSIHYTGNTERHLLDGWSRSDGVLSGVDKGTPTLIKTREVYKGNKWDLYKHGKF